MGVAGATPDRASGSGTGRDGAEAPLGRRLAAIVAADVAGFSRLMERDESGTVARLKALRRELIEPTLERLGGRFVDLKGDGAVVEFGSVAAAVEAAVAIQRAMAEHEAPLPLDDRIRYRIGVNLGDVVVDGADIYGDGVNLAARIEALCEPGGVWLSRSVLNQVRTKLDLAFEPTGTHWVKNISEPVETWRVRLEARPAGRRRASPFRAGRRLAAPALAALAALALLGGGWWLWPGDGSPPVARGMMPDRPSLAVLAFDNFSGDPEQGYLADGLAEDVITELARNRDLVVMARNSSFSFKGQGKTAQHVARELGVRYVLEGSMRRAGERLVINAQLIDGRDGRHVWADRYEIGAADVHVMQEQLVDRIAGTLFSEVRESEKAASFRRAPGNLDAYALTLRGLALKHRQSKENFLAGRDALERAIELDPHYAPAHVYLGFLNAVDAFSAVTGELGLADLPAAIATIRRGLALDPTLASGYQALSAALAAAGQARECLEAAQRAVALGPSDAENILFLARAETISGHYERAIANAERAIALNPITPPYYHAFQAQALYARDRFDEAAATAAACVTKAPGWTSCRIMLIASLAAKGDLARAGEEMAEALRRRPTFRLEHARALLGYPSDPPLTARLLDQLRAAGLPGEAGA